MTTVTYTLETLKQSTFGELTILEELSPKIYTYSYRKAIVRQMRCQCSCGKQTIVSLNNLLRLHQCFVNKTCQVSPKETLTTRCGCKKETCAKAVLEAYRSQLRSAAS